MSVDADHDGDKIIVQHNPIDPCVFMLMPKQHDRTMGLLLTHVDDLMLLAEASLAKKLQQELGTRFPVDEWQQDDFEYVGCKHTVSDNAVFISQKGYTKSRVSRVTIGKSSVVEPEQIEENRTSIGSLSWQSRQTRPDIQFFVSQAQKRQNAPELEDLKFTNKAVNLASKHKDEGIHIRAIEEGQIAFLAYRDAAWGNADLEDGFDPQWTGSHQVASQIGSLIFMVHKDCLGGRGGPFSLIDWKSKGCQRVCRSTFAGETMACCEATESGLFLRALFLSMIHGKIIPEQDGGKFFELHRVTDCKSLYDHIRREGVPKSPTEKRLAIDLAGVRQTRTREAQFQWKRMYGEDASHAPERPCRPPLHWLPTQSQLADLLTMAMNVDEWWATLRSGQLQLPLKR